MSDMTITTDRRWRHVVPCAGIRLGIASCWRAIYVPIIEHHLPRRTGHDWHRQRVSGLSEVGKPV